MPQDYDVTALLADTRGQLAGDYVAAFRAYLLAVVLRNAPQTREARLRLEDVMREALGRGAVLGALGALRKAAKVYAADGNFAADRSRLLSFGDTAAKKILTRVTFEEALEDIVNRTPVTLKDAAERTAYRIAQLYGEDGRGVIAFAKAAEESVTERAQALIAQALREGIPEREVGRSLAFDANRVQAETADWTESYARMAFRTNLGDAVAKGRMETCRDPDIMLAVPAFRFSAVGDGDTRDNHAAADGMILAVDDPRWERLRPPWGYNCRCDLHEMTRPELRRMGRLDSAGKVIPSKVPAGAGPDPGFRPGSPG